MYAQFLIVKIEWHFQKMDVFTTKAPRFMFIKIFCWLTLVDIKKRKQNKSRFTFNERAFLVFNCSKAKQVRTFPLKSKFPASQGRFLLSMNTTKSLIQNRHWKLGHRSAICWNYLGLFRDYGLDNIFLVALIPSNKAGLAVLVG